MAKSLTLVALMFVAAVGGWLWGANGRWRAERALQAIELQQNLVQGRSALLDTRLAIYSVNFGEASQHLERARALLRSAHDQLQQRDRAEDVTRIVSALTGVDEAQRLVGNMDQNANTRAGDAAKLVADVLAAGAAAGTAAGAK